MRDAVLLQGFLGLIAGNYDKNTGRTRPMSVICKMSKPHSPLSLSAYGSNERAENGNNSSRSSHLNRVVAGGGSDARGSYCLEALGSEGSFTRASAVGTSSFRSPFFNSNNTVFWLPTCVQREHMV